MEFDTYNVHFMYEGGKSDRYTRTYKSILESLYVRAYNRYCEVVNPFFESWNIEYDGENDGFDDEGRINPDSHYNKFIQNKEQMIIDKFINPFFIGKMEQMFIKRFYSGEDCEFRMEMHDGATMSFYLKKV